MLPSRKRIIVMSSCLGVVALVGFSHMPMGETEATSGNYTTDFDNAVWRDAAGSDANRADYAKAPFTIEESSASFIFSAGYDDPTIGPRLGSINTASYDYHDFDHQTLAPFRPLTATEKEAVIALKTPLIDKKMTSLTFDYTATPSGTITIYYIYSGDDGNTWKIMATDSTYGKTTMTFSQTLDGHHLQFGILAANTKASPQSITQPRLQYAYEDLTDTEVAASFNALVLGYSPCTSDELGLTATTDAIAASLRFQYLELNGAQKTAFDALPGKARLDFILAKHGLG